MRDYVRPVPDSVRTLFHQDGVEFGKYGRQLGLIGEAVQPGNEAIKPIPSVVFRSFILTSGGPETVGHLLQHCR